MKKLDKKLVSKVYKVTVMSQNDIINRLKLYDFAKSAISIFCQQSNANFENYDFVDFKAKFKLVEFKKEKEIAGISHKDIITVGNKFIENELADSIFVLNISTFENWILTVLNLVLVDNKTEIFKSDERSVDISIIQESSNIDELWERIVGKYLQKLPYSGIKSMLQKLLKEFGVKQSVITPDLIGKINENSLCRNSLVHSQKKVNDDYLTKSGIYARFKKGEIIKINDVLLFEQGDNLLRFMQDFRNSINT